MRWISIGLFVLHSATLIYVLQQDSGIKLGVQVGNVIYSAEFPRRALKPENLIEGTQIHAATRRAPVPQGTAFPIAALQGR
jgi:hypothetical protein